MPGESSTFARVTFLDVGALHERVTAAARQLVAAHANVAAVVLFGSLADGTATPASDVDLLVLLHHDSRRVLDRVPDYTIPWEHLGVGVQVFPWTVDELLSRLADGDPWPAEILRHGHVIAGRLPNSPEHRSVATPES